jgi:shikimate kinase
MDLRGRAAAPAAGTILNALATGVGSAFAIDREVEATVHLDGSDSVDAQIVGMQSADTTLVERCVERTVEAVTEGLPFGGTVETESEVPIASGLKSSSAAANATVLATLAALGADDDVEPLRATRIGVAAARDAGVTVTGAFDDATASMLGGVTVTDNGADELLARDTLNGHVAVWIPPETMYSADADIDRCERVAPVADVVSDLALEGRFELAMTINGFAFCAALERPTEPMLEALPDAAGVSLSGTGPSFVALADEDVTDRVVDRWRDRPGEAWATTTRSEGARVR